MGFAALACVFSVLCLPSLHDPPTTLDLAETLAPIRAKANLPALAGAIVRGNDVVAIGCVGVRRKGEETPATADDLWHIGSCTKAMTATLCALLVDDGTLKWDSTPAQVFPDLAESMDPAWRAATLKHLLTNRAGVPADLNRDGLWGRLWARRDTAVEQRHQLASGVLAWKPSHEPGTTFEYANAGFALAGHMAETVAGKPFEDLIRERLFIPLGMTSAGFGAPGSPAEPATQPWGHRGATPVPPGPTADNPPAIAPAGTLHMSLRDWARFISLHVRGHAENPNRETRLLRADSFDTLQTPAAGEGARYAMGWIVSERPWADGVVLTHAGSNTTWYCVVWAAPRKDLAVLVATNAAGEGAPQACDEASAALIRVFRERVDAP